MVGLVKRRGGLFHQFLLCIPSDTCWSFDKNSRHLYLLVVLVSSIRTIEPIKRVRCAAFIITPTVSARKHFLKSACLLLVERRMPESTLRQKNIYDMACSWTQTWQLTRVITASSSALSGLLSSNGAPKRTKRSRRSRRYGGWKNPHIRDGSSPSAA